jgi:release factor glutamine methyltransferase
MRFIDGLNIQGKTFLELGAGSGLIAFNAAKHGAVVTASDINTVAIEYLKKNRRSNNLNVQVIASNLFASIPKQQFDIIAINPPYYKKNPVSEADYAWFCGENSEYFVSLFKQLGEYVHSNSGIYMILCDGCDIELIKTIAASYNFNFTLQQATKNIVEMNYIFNIEKEGVANA